MKRKLNWLFFLNNRGEVTPPVGAGGTPPAPSGGAAPASVSVNVNNQDGTPPAPEYKEPTIDFKTALPVELRDKPYFKDMTFGRLVKEFDGLQTKLGAPRLGAIPTETSKPEEVTAFYSALKPKEAKEYAFPETEFSKQFGKDDKFQETMRGVFHKAGLSKHQATVLAQEYDNVLLGMKQEEKNQQAATDKQYEDVLDKTYGANKQQALDVAKKLMIESVPVDLKPALEKLSPDALAILTTTLNAVHNKYIKEDVLDGQGAGGSVDVAALQAKAIELMKSPAYKDFRVTGHDAVQEEVRNIYKQIAAAQTPQKK